MKKIICLFLLVVSIFCFASCNQTKENNAVVRTSDVQVNDADYFDSFVNTNTETEYRVVAKKKISGEALQDFDTVSLIDDDYLITFDAVADLELGTVTLNVYFDNTEELIIENFVGIPMTNYNDEEDIMFNIDGQHVFLSELNVLSLQEQCSFFGSLFKGVCNVAMAVSSVVEPVVKVMSNFNAIWVVNKLGRKDIRDYNYEFNSLQTQPSDFVCNQNASYWKSWYYSNSTLYNAGCGVIAGYNLCYALGKNITLAETIWKYEYLGLDFVYGYWGTNPYQIKTFLDDMVISYDQILSYKNFKNLMEDTNNYYVILVEWNGDYPHDSAHFFLIDKSHDENNKIKYRTYNYDGYYASPYYNVSDLFAYNPKTDFICAYFVSK